MRDFGNIVDDTFDRQIYFPTMIFAVDCANFEDLNAYLLPLIYSERDRDEAGIERSNYRALGGWHSHNNLHRDERYAPLVSRIDQAGQRISEDLGYDDEYELKIGTMWAITNGPGSVNKAHIHPGSYWSGVYYVQTPKDSGDIEFIDPRTAHLMDEPNFKKGVQRSRENWTKVRFRPQAGKMLLFPSWLYHGVDPNLTNMAEAEADRIIVSFNLYQVRN